MKVSKTIRVNTNLDYFKGEYWSCGIKGEHLGLTNNLWSIYQMFNKGVQAR